MTIRIPFLAVAAYLATSLAAAAAPVVILTGSAGGQGPGAVVDDAQLVELAPGAVLIFNDAAGQTRTLTGPYQGPIGAPPPTADASTSALERLVAARSVEQSRLGAIRAAPGQTPRDPELISIAHSATQCFRDAGAARLWRPETLNVDSRLLIRALDDDGEATVFWRAGEGSIAWPAALPLRSGGRYLVRLEAAPRAVELALHQAPMDRAGTEALAERMVGAGCRRQALALLDRVVN